ncbi:MAG: hypothetical protein JNL74_07455 [Fibrobacteres bacterium]|nr:hypothetical protein [Fibrobacterota bacterium]
MCELENIMFEPFDNHEKLHGLMGFLLKIYVNHQKIREANGRINFHADRSGKYQPILEYRVHCAHLPEKFKVDGIKRLEYEWPYLSAQTSSGFGPDMFRSLCRITMQEWQNSFYIKPFTFMDANLSIKSMKY